MTDPGPLSRKAYLFGILAGVAAQFVATGIDGLSKGDPLEAVGAPVALLIAGPLLAFASCVLSLLPFIAIRRLSQWMLSPCIVGRLLISIFSGIVITESSVLIAHLGASAPYDPPLVQEMALPFTKGMVDHNHLEFCCDCRMGFRPAKPRAPS